MGCRSLHQWPVRALALGTLVSSAAAQTTISQWNFNSNPGDASTSTGSFVPSFGTGTCQCFNVAPSGPLAECIFASGTGSTDPDTADDTGWQTRGYQVQSSGPGTAGVEFAVSTVNFSSIIVTWDQRHSNTSSRYVALFYSTNGTTFTQAPGAPFEGNMGDTWFNTRTVDLSAIPGANNNPNFKFRISPVFDPNSGTSYVASNTASTYAPTGTHRFDMVTVAGTPLTSIPPAGTATASPGAVCAGGGQVTFSVAVTPGINPASTGLTVLADLTTVGGAAAASLLDDGMNGDAMLGDNIFTLVYAVPGSVTVGPKTIPVAVADAELRSTMTSLAFTVADCSTSSAARVVISQMYGGGANAGPPAGVLDADFVELYNRSALTVDLTGWSVQYASAGSAAGFDNAADRVPLSGVIRPGQYLLVRYSDPGALGAPLPTPDFIGRGGMGNSAGRVALVRSTVLIGANCADVNVEDLAAYGGAICFEGAAPSGATANDSGALRKVAGAQDTNQNFNDFIVGTPTPRNRAAGGFLAGYGSLNTRAVCAGDGIQISVNVSAGASPPSTGIVVRADLSQIGGSATQALNDQGGGLYTLAYTIPGSVSQGGKVIALSVTDGQSRSDASVLTLTVATCVNSTARVVISGFLGGGGNNGAPFNADYIEIFNRSGSSVDLTGWSAQYANADSAAGFLLSQTVLLSGSIGAGEYRLVKTSNPGANGVPLPTPDFNATPAFGMDNLSGRVAVVRVSTPLGTNCASADIEDLVGYGSLAICFEGIGATDDISNTVGFYRKGNGCQDFNHNSVDLEVFAPLNLPRNSASPANPCVVATNGACCSGATCATGTAASCTGVNTLFAGVNTVCNVFPSNVSPCCFADYNHIGGIGVQDIFDFLAGYFGNSPQADINGGGVSVQDIFDFLSAYFAGGC